MRPLGAVFYSGPSTIDGDQILGIVVFGRSTNRKTGAMLQTYILRADREPVAAVRSGHDASICGECPLRGILGKARACYVDLGKGPTVVYRAWKRGRYAPELTPAHATYLSGRSLRRGTYGDPAAIPAHAWRALEVLTGPARRTGYTHQWRTDRSQIGHAMASVETPADRERAKREGWRTFRVRGPSDPLLPGEIVCPASEEGGRKTTCARCGLCNGAGPKRPTVDVAIMAHGIGARAFAGAAS